MQRKPLMQTTSRDAFRDFDPSTVDGRILAFVKAQGERGATVAEIEEALSLPHQTASAQVSHLRAPGRNLLHASNEKRPTPRGRAAVVWKYGPGASMAPFPIANPIVEQLDLGVR